MSQAKDRSLTIMVSGKPSAVVQARREILTKLQTQVSLLVPETCASYTIKYEYNTCTLYILVNQALSDDQNVIKGLSPFDLSNPTPNPNPTP